MSALIGCLFAAILALPATQDARHERDEALLEAVDALAQQALAEGARGVVLAVTVAGEVLCAQGYGFADEHRATRLTPEVPQPVGALLPTFLAVAALRLSEQEALDLEAPLARYVPELDLGDELRVDRLLTHTSGIPSYALWFEGQGDSRRPFPAESILSWLATVPLDAPPGSCVEYCLSNDFLLGLVLERVSGKSLATVLETSVFAPAGMEDTGWCGEAEPRTRPPTEQELGDGPVAPGGTPAPFVAERLCASAFDLVRFQRALESGRLLSKESLALRTEPPVTSVSGVARVGRGLALHELGGLAGQTAGGALVGSEVVLADYPEARISVVALLSGSRGRARPLATSVVRTLLALEGPLVRDLALGRAERARLVGAYSVACTNYEVTEEGEHLRLWMPTGEPYWLLNQGGPTFVAAEDPDVRVHFELAGGRASALLLTEHGFTLRATRVR